MAIPTQLKHVVRRLRRTPVFTVLTLVTLAVGIGANAAIFSVVQGVLLRPLPYPRPDELVGVWHTAPGVNIDELNSAPSLYFTYREQGRTFQDVGLWSERAATVTGLAEPERVTVIRVTNGTLPILGVAPQLGRAFSAEDDTKGAPQTVVLSYSYWQTRFGGDPAAIGRRMVVDGEASEIIGVMPREFRFLDVKAAFFLPMQFDRNKVFLGQFSFNSVARLKPGATIAHANADVARMLPIAFESFPAPPDDGLDRKAPATAYWPILMKGFEADGVCRSLSFVVRTPRAGTEGLLKEIREAVWSVNANLPLASVQTLETVYERSMARTAFTMVMLALAGGMALLLGVVGIYGVISYTVSHRTREIGIRMALGARREELTRMFVRQGLALASIGAACGLVAALGLGRVMSALLFGVQPADPMTLSLVAVALVGAAALASYLPARRVADVDPVEALRAE